MISQVGDRVVALASVMAGAGLDGRRIVPFGFLLVAWSSSCAAAVFGGRRRTALPSRLECVECGAAVAPPALVCRASVLACRRLLHAVTVKVRRHGRRVRVTASTGWRTGHGGVQWRLSDFVGLPLGGRVQTVHAADAVEGVPHLHGELVERHEQVVDDAVSGGARPRVSMGVFGGSGGSNVGEGGVVVLGGRGIAISTDGGRVSAGGGLLAFARAAERSGGRVEWV